MHMDMDMDMDNDLYYIFTLNLPYKTVPLSLYYDVSHAFFSAWCTFRYIWLIWFIYSGIYCRIWLKVGDRSIEVIVLIGMVYSL